ncbi:uncharacterized protein LOC129760452 [Uranotaenia lowii]|uniref:uncharacterized protein LOC129760452 n=1 Tax=Uranotaenia lowii TaxID=190385 RepID=UPI002479D396|nr:uncharacterized protein LOC129760452 [Uranotaenia lowii]
MAGQKFFHGLTEAMINRGAERPDRQKSNFYWPEEYLEDPQDRFVTSSRRQSTSSAATTPKECPSPASEIETGEVMKQRHRSNIRSHIEFSDENDSAFSQLARERQREKLRIEQFLRQQSDDVSEAAKTKRQNTLKSRIQFYDYVETPNGGRASPRKLPANGYHTPTTPDFEDHPSTFGPQTTNGISNGGTNYRRQLSSPASSEYHYSARYTGSYDDFEEDDARSYRSSNELNFSPPGTPLSNGGDIPEHKRQSHRHLRSSIAFCNGVVMADEGDGGGKSPVSVRDSAAMQRVGVGLPNL